MEIMNTDAQNVKVVEKVVEKVVPVKQTDTVTKVETYPILPDRPLTQGELNWLMYQAKANHREVVLGHVMSGVRTVAGLGCLLGFGFGIYKLYKSLSETEMKDDITGGVSGSNKSDFVDATGYTK